MASSIPVNGYLYTAYGDEHIEEALVSVASLRKADSTAHVSLVSDRDVEGFDQVYIASNIKPGLAGKVQTISTEFYSRATLYLDSDTYVCEDPSGLFELVNWFDVCAVPDPAEVEILKQSGLVSYNTGVVLLSKKRTTKFMDNWKRFYFNNQELLKVLEGHPARKSRTDQPSFLQALMHTDVKFHALPDVWNARYRFNISLMGSVKIIHGKSTDFEKVREEMNASLGNRTWLAKRGS